SRRRHTRSKRDWSSDVCSSDLGAIEGVQSIPLTDDEYEAAQVSPGETAAILYTSGTTGVAKGVICPHAQFYWWGRNMSTQMPLHSDDVLHTMLPLFHTNALNTFFQALRSEEHTSELQSRFDLVCRLLLAKKDKS